MKKIKLILISIAIILLLLQLMPRHNDNISTAATLHSIDKAHQVPAEILESLKKSCYDCHSNNTYYPWYASIQPVSNWLNHHIEEGREELDFSTFGDYSIRRQYHKLAEMKEQLEDHEMPLSSYTLIHREAALSPEKQSLIIGWIDQLRDSFKTVYPQDSLIRKRRS